MTETPKTVFVTSGLNVRRILAITVAGYVVHAAACLLFGVDRFNWRMLAPDLILLATGVIVGRNADQIPQEHER